MSTILEALKKAEKESGGRLEIAPRPPIRSGNRKGMIVGVVVVTIAIGLWIGYSSSIISPVVKSESRREGEPFSVESHAPAGVEASLPVPQTQGLPQAQVLPGNGPHEIDGGEVPSAESEPPSLDLSGVIYDPVRPMAIMNGRLVGVGDSASGAKILRIEKDSVRISFGGREETIRIKK